MIVNEFENTKEYRLQQIINTLKSIHGYELDLGSKSTEQIQSLNETCEIVKNSIVKESRFNTWMQNPEYTKNMLIMEAIRIYLTEIAPKRMNKKARKVKESHEINEVDPGKMVDMHELGVMMMDYSQSQRPRGDDDREIKILNVISDVGDKLTRLGSPFGPKTLTDMDRKVIEVAKRRMGLKSAPDTLALPGLSETGAQPAPAIPGAPNATSNIKPGMIKMRKNNQEKDVQANQMDNMRKQGWNVVADVEEASHSQEFSPELLALMDKYGVGDDVDESNKFIGALDAAIKAGEDKFEVDGETYPVTTDKLSESAHMNSHDDYQADMARSELYRNTKYAMDMMKMIGPDDEVKPWILGGLTKAANYLDKIYHYMDYHTTFKSDQHVEDTPLDEDDDKDYGETTGGACRQNLLMIMEYSTKLFRMIQPGDKLEGWVAMKLTTASECISSSKHYLDYAQFERHVGEEIADMDQDVVAMKETKKDKKVVKEGRLVTISNILMREMLKEEQDLEQAQTLLAAKSMSDELQGMAEKLAKMSVEDLMPLVDTMKEQFGQDMANGFNGVMKSSLEAVLNSMTSAKETTDNAILSMQQGQVPGVATDMETAEPPALGEPEGDEETEDDFEATPAAAGEKTEPLGRKKKPEAENSDLVDIEESKKSDPTVSVWFYFPMDTKTYRDIEDKIEKAVGIDSDGSGTDFKDRDISFSFDSMSEANAAVKAVKKLKIKGLRHEISKHDNLNEAKKAQEPGAVATAQVMKMGSKFVTKDGKHLTKAGIKKRDEIIRAIEREQKLEESNMNDFIRNNAAAYKKAYGDNWENKLYESAWLKFGQKSTGFAKAVKLLESTKKSKQVLVKAFEVHKSKYKKMVSEGIVKDPLNTGYGLEGQNILDQLGNTNSMISKLSQLIKSEIANGIKDIRESKELEKRSSKLETARNSTPFGVVWKANGKTEKKFFESADLRKYWVDLNSDVLTNHKLVDPADFDNKIRKLKV